MAQAISSTTDRLAGKWQTLLLLALGALLGMSVWFSASAVVPALTEAWNLREGTRAWLTMSVQIGFVFGALGSAILGLADRLSAKWMFAVSAVLAGLFTALIPVLASGPTLALILRFLTGMVLAGVYPVAMKIMATWTKADRGLGIGLLVGALAVGSAAPHLINGMGGSLGSDWRTVLYVAGGLAVVGGALAVLFVSEGPYKGASPKFEWSHVGHILKDKSVMLANGGYLGHMWELYAMWTWIVAFLLASFEVTGTSPNLASLTTFGVISMGGLGSLIAGQLADRLGRTTITMASMVVSGILSLTIGLFFGGSPALLIVLSLVWGFFIVADSAQFSASVSELANPSYVGTALTLQTSMGFLLTLVTIRLVPPVVNLVGWRWAFAFLAIGPLLGILSMWTLRTSPEASKLANGNR